MTQLTQPHPDELLTAKECCRILKISITTFHRLRREGRIPPPQIKTSRTTLRWRRGDLLAALEPIPDPRTEQGRLLAVSTHMRAAAMQARAAAAHADTAAAQIRNITVAIVSPTAIAAKPPTLSQESSS